MQIVKVKICGITNYEDAIASVESGADIIGFNLYKKSPRYITPEKVCEITEQLPGFAETSLIFVNETKNNIYEAIEKCQPSWIQFHGDEDPDFCNNFEDFNIKTMKAVRVKSEKDLEQIKNYYTDAVLLDAFNPDKYGGTGTPFDWGIITSDFSKRIFLAGGINPQNAPLAAELGVYGIDVCSGVEENTGKKDIAKIKTLFDNIAHLRA
jgi:phosphoribosylanthranilate isomerase